MVNLKCIKFQTLKKEHMDRIDQNAKDYVDRLWDLTKKEKDKFDVRISDC